MLRIFVVPGDGWCVGSTRWQMMLFCPEMYEAVVVVVVSSLHQSPRCGVLRLRSAQSITIPLSVWSASISPAH